MQILANTISDEHLWLVRRNALSLCLSAPSSEVALVGLGLSPVKSLAICVSS